ncbi:MAG: hypothetical protein HY270_11075 [Deltaproteobacteria bacterium]|nr:hypothetical protein [Deltaproteobacteria bacterium]
MRSVTYSFVLLSFAAIATAGVGQAQTVCTVADIVAQEASCPASGICTITKTYTVGSPCMFDFGSRDVVMAAGARLNFGSGTVTVQAASLTMQANAATGAFIDGRGQGAAAPSNAGGRLEIDVANGFSMQRNGTTRSRIDVSANGQAGTVIVNAGGSVSINGRVNADNLTVNAGGGTIKITAGGDLTSDPQSQISATGGNQALTGGGDIELYASGTLNLGDSGAASVGMDVSGNDAGTVCLYGGGDVIMHGVVGSATGESGSGATVTIEAGHNVQILGQILMRGGELDPTAGGDGGTLCVHADYGNVTFGTNADVFAEGSSPDGDGGEIDITVDNGSLTVMFGATISARTNGGQGVGGALDIEIDQGITTAALLDVSGGSMGGDACVDASGPVTLGGGIDARGYDNGGAGGNIEVSAGLDGLGALIVQDTITAGGGPCGIVEGCGDGGTTALSGCDVTITSSGSVLARAPGTGGSHQLTAREQLRIDGVVSATKSFAGGADGSIEIVHRKDKPPIIRSGGALPAPTFSPMDTCSATVVKDCLDPCPVCGNGIVEYPETCDGGNRVNCDGCSSLCQTETCPLGLPCLTCDPQLGCLCPTPPEIPTATPTQTPTRTATATRTPTSAATAAPTGSPTNTPLPTLTESPSVTPTPVFTDTPLPTLTDLPTLTATPTPSETPTSTSTATDTPSATETATLTPTATPTPSDTPTNTSTATDTPSATETSTPTPSATDVPSNTPTVPPSCTGDCGGDSEVTIDELLTVVNIALEIVPPSACPAGDSNGDGQVTIDEILAAVNNALNGCP